MLIRLPWPDKRLSPNSKRRSHWRSYNDVAANARADAADYTIAALTPHLPAARRDLEGDGTIPVTVTFYPPDRRHRDDDGMIGSFKHARDGIADALQVNDRRFRPTYVFADPCKPGKIEVAFG